MQQSQMEMAVTSKQEFLTFIIGREQFGVEIQRVQEIRGWERPNPLPNVPPFVKGVVDLRGNIVPIIDLRERFRLKAEYKPTTVVIVVHVLTSQGERTVGLVVDAVSDVKTFDINSLQPPPDTSTDIKAQFIIGLASIESTEQSRAADSAAKVKASRMVVLVNIDRLVNEGLIEEITSDLP
ncbi:chemotaxis protein CheW [Thiosulfatimonas sediminis]|uniref:chemotaxis protein CheW n=1 Tax=Thiosulfatimonas sediminis TaxID=2675054 RepID=UPI001FBB376D|nr:chemotaxis protein CheW [Thiosulfatimonas sediminis]